MTHFKCTYLKLIQSNVDNLTTFIIKITLGKQVDYWKGREFIIEFKTVQNICVRKLLLLLLFFLTL